ncbi:MAG: type II secretion system protein [Myxococcota bacterium]
MRRARGMTLIEMMIVVALTSIIMMAAVATFSLMLNQRRRAERILEVNNAITIATSRLQFDLANAGFRFPAAAFAVRIINNVDTSTALKSSVGDITTTQNCGATSFGLVPGTDVIEISIGDELATSVPTSFPTTSGNTFGFYVSSWNLIPPAIDQVVMVTNPAGDACIGRVTNFAGGTVTADYLSPDFAGVDPSPSTTYPNCPGVLMNAYRLGRRVRYMVCQDPANANRSPGLYVQNAGPDGRFTGMPELAQDGVEDFQLAPRLLNVGSTISGTGCTTIGGTSYCVCDDTTGPCSGVDGNGNAADSESTVINAGSHEQWVRGLRFGITARGLRPTDPTSKAYRRPALFDHPAATAAEGDGFSRLTETRFVTFDNLTTVKP